MRKQCVPGAPSDFSSAWERGYPHSDSRSDFSAYVTSRIQYATYKIIATCIERAIERATVL